MPLRLRKRASHLIFWLCLTIFMSSPKVIWGSDIFPHPFNVDVRSAVLLDAKSGEVVYGQNPKERIQPASLVKILTLFLVFDAAENGQVSLEENVLVSKKAWRTKGSKMFIEVGARVPLVELVKGIAVVSGNDACVAVGEFLQGSEQAFVEKMNEKLDALGMRDTRVQTTNGLPASDQYTTAADMALLARAYVRAHPEALQYHKLTKFTSEGVSQRNRNGLLWLDPSVDGLKTGYVSRAGYHLIATARREDQRFIAVVMGAKNPKVREREALRLLNYGFRNYVSMPLFEKGQVLLQLPIWKGTAEKVGLVAAKSEVITVPVPLKNFVSQQIKAPEKLLAPIRRGEHLGKLLITANHKVLKSIALVADREVLQGGLLKRTVDTVVLQCKAHNMRLISVIILSAVVPSFLWCKSRRRQNRRRQNRYLPV